MQIIGKKRVVLLVGAAVLCALPILAGQPGAGAPPADEQQKKALDESFRAFALAGSRGYLGVGVKDVDADRVKALKLKEESGVEVTNVEADGPAAKAGLKNGDVVLQYNGQRIEGTEQFVRFVRETPVGRAVKLLVSRDGQTQTLTATLGTRRSGGVAFSPGMPGMPGMWDNLGHRLEMRLPDIPNVIMATRSAMLGVEAESLSSGSQLAGFFGVKEGVLVRSVTKGTAAEKAGIRAGDVLLKVDGSKVVAPRDVTQALRGAREGNRRTLPVVLTRDKKEVTLQVTLDEEKSEIRRPVRAVSTRRLEL